MTIQEIPAAVEQLQRSERGQTTCKMLHEFLSSRTVNFLDDENSLAVASLVAHFMLGGGNAASQVVESLERAIK